MINPIIYEISINRMDGKHVCTASCFDPEHKRRGIGLSNIQSRTELLDGQLEIITGLGNGCKLKIAFPESCE